MTDKFYAVFPPQSDIKSERNAAFNITRLTSFDNLLFIGCREGLLLQSVFEETEENVTCYSFSLIISRKVTEYPIADLSASSATAIVVILAGGQLQIFDAETLERFTVFPSLSSVVSFSLQGCFTEKDAFSKLAVCLQASTLNIYRITRSRCDVTYSVQLPSLAPVMLCATDFLVFATPTHYFCLDFKTKRINELFARTEKHVKPLIAQVSETEFLLSGPGALGIFVDSTGASQRPPIPLSSNLSSLFCYDSLIFAIDDEFVSIHSTKNQEQLQTLVVKNTSAACMSLDGKRLFLAPRQAVRSPQIYTVRSETWDMVARRLILAGCTTEAQDCVQRQYRRLLDLCAERPATSSTAKILFTARSKRVFTLMGFYFFEIGRLQEAKQFFEKSSLNVCELLYRYVDLLPRGYTFTPSDDLNVSVAVQAQVENTATASPNTIFDLAESLASRSKDSDSCVREYRIFLLDFLLEHRRSRIFEKHTQFVETALFKLCVLLQDYVSTNLLTPESSLSATYGSWEALISSFRNVDVKDLLTFLTENGAHHAHALLCSWQGDLSTALDLWRRLAFGELNDHSFPGPNFYLNTLVTILVKPLSFHGDSPSLLRAASPDQLPTAGRLVGSPLHADLVWQHLCSMLAAEQTWMAEQLLVQLARLTLWRDGGMNVTGPAIEPSARPFEVNRPLASFPLSPENLLCKLLPEFPVLAERYLWHRVFDAGDKDVTRHAILADLQLDLLLKATEGSTEEFSRCRARFQETLLCPDELPLDRLLEKVTISQQHNLLEERIILLCRLERHEDALKILLHERRDIDAALRYCNWCVIMHLRLCAARETAMWSESPTSEQPKEAKAVGSSNCSAEPNVYGTLFGLLLEDSGKSGSFKSLLRLLNSEIPMSDSVEVFRQLPPELPLPQVVHFLRRTLRSVLCAVSASEVDRGLYKGLFASSAIQAEAAAPAPLVLQEDTVCAACNIRLDAYGPAKPFAWLLPDNKAVHLHCLPSDSVI